MIETCRQEKEIVILENINNVNFEICIHKQVPLLEMDKNKIGGK